VSAQALHSTEQDRALFGDADLPGDIDAARGGTLLVRCFEDLRPDLQHRVLATAADDDHRLVATCYANCGRTPERTFSAALLSSFSSVVEVPPLRARVEDIDLLASCISKRVADANGWSSVPLANDELERLRGHAWPGNVRELMLGLLLRGLTLHRGEAWTRLSFLDS